MLQKILNKIRELKNKNAILNLNCSQFEVDNWVISKFIIKKLIPIVGVKPFPICELSLMVAIVCRFKPTHIFEWGTHIGKSARIFYETAEYFNIKTEIHSIDLPDSSLHNEHPGNKRGKLVRGLPNVFLYQGDGLDKSLEIIKNIKEKCRPLFFVDGDHVYESVKRELIGIITNVPNAQILLHDTFYQSEESGYNIGPHQAIKDVLGELKTNYSKIETNTGLPGMTLLYKL